MSYRTVINPIGVLRALNTRAYEVMYSGRLLLQHTVGSYRRHEEMLRDKSAVIFFKSPSELKRKIGSVRSVVVDDSASLFEENCLSARMRSIGVDI
jgi:hypothetical protein